MIARSREVSDAVWFKWTLPVALAAVPWDRSPMLRLSVFLESTWRWKTELMLRWSDRWGLIRGNKNVQVGTEPRRTSCSTLRLHVRKPRFRAACEGPAFRGCCARDS